MGEGIADAGGWATRERVAGIWNKLKRKIFEQGYEDSSCFGEIGERSSMASCASTAMHPLIGNTVEPNASVLNCSACHNHASFRTLSEDTTPFPYRVASLAR